MKEEETAAPVTEVTTPEATTHVPPVIKKAAKKAVKKATVKKATVKKAAVKKATVKKTAPKKAVVKKAVKKNKAGKNGKKMGREFYTRPVALVKQASKTHSMFEAMKVLKVKSTACAKRLILNADLPLPQRATIWEKHPKELIDKVVKAYRNEEITLIKAAGKLKTTVDVFKEVLTKRGVDVKKRGEYTRG